MSHDDPSPLTYTDLVLGCLVIAAVSIAAYMAWHDAQHARPPVPPVERMAR